MSYGIGEKEEDEKWNQAVAGWQLTSAIDSKTSATYDGRDFELAALDVALLEELVGHELGHFPLDLPRLCDCRHVARRHQHAAQQLPVAILPPVVSA